MCRLLKINKKTYYKYRYNAFEFDKEDFELINKVFEEGRRTYGVLRIKKALEKKYNIVMNHKKIRRIMRKYGLVVAYMNVYKKKIRQEVLKENIKCNKIKGNFETNKPNQKWVTDITYLNINNKKAYLSTIIDLYERKIVSYKIKEKMDLSLVMDTLKSAIDKNENEDLSDLMIHSDQGSQYTSYAYQKLCNSKNIEISMSRPGVPSDNAPMESFHSSLKRETLYSNYYFNIDEYINDIKEWLYFYNTDRITL